MPTTMPTGFTLLPTAFQLPASNPPYPPAVGSASRAHSIPCSDRLRWRCARSNHSSDGHGAMTITREGQITRRDQDGGIDLLTPACVLRAQNGRLSTRQGHRGFRVDTCIQYQLQISGLALVGEPTGRLE
jgi:hypothetical protein